MKARRFLAVVLAVTLLLLGLGAGAWWLVWQRSPLQLQHRPLVPPRSARFVPRDAALSFYLLSDAEQPVAYARAVAPPRQRRQAGEAIAGLRDGAFAAAGLDYRGELASWLGEETGLWLLEDPGRGTTGWVLALSSRDGDGARRFLQRFWQTRSLAGTELQISSYRGMGLISGRGALVGREPMPLATALIDDDLVLLASGRGALEQALDVSQIDDLNQAADPALRRRLDALGPGTALLTARPSALQRWLGTDLPGTASALVAALHPEGRELVLEGWLASAPGAALPPQGQAGSADLVQAVHAEADALALVQDPAHWPASWKPVLEPLVAAFDEERAGAVASILLAAADGPVLWRQGADGWLLGTAPDHPPAAAVEAALRERGLVEAPLAVPGGATVQAWTRLQAAADPQRRGKGAGQVQASLGVARSVGDGWAWWSDSLTLLGEQRQSRSQPRPLLARLQSLERPAASLQWAGGHLPAQELLQRWSGWRLLSALAGQPLAEPVQGLGLALEPEGEAVRLQVRLTYGA
ncbi:MAG: DUF3352 domain-containing protein [Cyanobacteria bacterium M_surface_10_m2_119]|nr:DUF3352 domain-containing protein [Cyanobacteria bacterium M_surface_10_m2_119]